MPLLGVLGLYLIPDKIKVRKMMEMAYFDDSKITPEDIEAYATPLSLPGANYAMQQTAKQITPENISELIAMHSRVNVPTLIVWGREDKIIPLENGVRLHQAIGNSQMVIIDRCGHSPQEDRPGEVMEAIR